MPTQRTTALLDLAYCAVFAALIIVLAFVSIPIGTAGVPIVLQNAAIILTGLVLGARRGFYVMAIVGALGLVLPVFSGGRTLTTAMSGPTAGYLIGYLISVVIAGLLAYRAPAGKRTTQALIFSLASLCALCVQLLLGSLGIMLRTGLELKAAILTQVPFLIGDLIKMIAIVVIALGVHSAFPQLLQQRCHGAH